MNRYSRHELFSGIGKKGQKRIRDGHVLILGLGALGASSSEMLTRAGVGRLTLIDRDYVDWTNLQRQRLYTEADATARMPKAAIAKDRLEAINKEVAITAHVMDATAEELERLILASDIDVIVDATDNFDARMMVNDLSLKHDVPWIYGACIGSYGMSYTFLPGQGGPCLTCLLDELPTGGPTCDTAGIIAPAVEIVVAHQVTNVLKLLTGATDVLADSLMTCDLWQNNYRTMSMHSFKRADCPSCGEVPTYPYLLRENHTEAAVLCGRDSVQLRPPTKREVALSEVARSLPFDHVLRNEYLLSFEVEEKRVVLFKDGRAMVHGTADVTEAKAVYYRYFG
ncbi:ThiF family adenylyltransferase [Paenalkalicoccus suaedae]|uniref:ThiF family adenylyltransferase n=1 Tax=Paenalkalicoccus suaedae TaxID=2592382 RepID=A0A859F9L8_9BACI|nr:ThiF family adenylyltransferase [Paenalkalicoccus suaedae]QKS69799.1 ThiF family adenylyltransferase [Paenalkalicoccus suaedae]